MLVIVDAAAGAGSSPALQLFVDTIAAAGGTVTDVEICGRRRTALPSGGSVDDGIYVRVSATVPSAAVAALDQHVATSGLRLHSSALAA